MTLPALPVPTTSIMEPGTRDWIGFGLLFALAVACYVVVWACVRAGARADEISERQVDAIRFHTPNLMVSPYDQELEVDHDVCEGCRARICRCHESQRTAALVVLCGNEDVAQGCGHGRSLCTRCAPGECDECLVDLGAQGVLSQYVTGTFPTGRAS